MVSVFLKCWHRLVRRSLRPCWGIGLSLVLLTGLTSGGSVRETRDREIAPQVLSSQLALATAPLILDVRSRAEYASGHIPKAVNVPYPEISEHLPNLSAFTDVEVVVYCEVGQRADRAKTTLRRAGFQHVINLTGDMQGWHAAKLPIATPPIEPTP